MTFAPQRVENKVEWLPAVDLSAVPSREAEARLRHPSAGLFLVGAESSDADALLDLNGGEDAEVYDCDAQVYDMTEWRNRRDA